MTFPFACPIDTLALHRDSAGFRCPNGHCYDVSKLGYLNLLPVQFKPSSEPGDSKPMVAARHRVLASGLYDPIATMVTDQVLDIRGRHPASFCVVDAGCGEGFYTHRIQQALDVQQTNNAICVLGCDISKTAIVAAAKNYRTLDWAVANNTRLPFVPGSVDLITSLFGFECWSQWSAMQSAGQSVLVVGAGVDHLIELRQLIYNTVENSPSTKTTGAIEAGYQLMSEQRLLLTQDVPPDLLLPILEMTPHIHRVAQNKLNTIDFSRSMGVTLDVTFKHFSLVD